MPRRRGESGGVTGHRSPCSHPEPRGGYPQFHLSDVARADPEKNGWTIQKAVTAGSEKRDTFPRKHLWSIRPHSKFLHARRASQVRADPQGEIEFDRNIEWVSRLVTRR